MVPGIEVSDWDREFISRARALGDEFFSIAFWNPRSEVWHNLPDTVFMENISIKNILGLLVFTRNNILKNLSDKKEEDRDFIRKWVQTVRFLRENVRMQVWDLSPMHEKNGEDSLLEFPYKTLFFSSIVNSHFLRNLSYEDQQVFRLKLERFVAAIKAEYQKLDRKKWRFDGTTHFSHAFETTLILTREIQCFDEVMLYGVLWHDFFEDVAHMTENEKKNTLKIILEDRDYEVYSHDREVIPLIDSLTKKSVEHYLADTEKETYGFTDEDYSLKRKIQFLENTEWTSTEQLADLKKLLKTLKIRRDEEYYGTMIDESKIPDWHDKDIFAFRKLIIKCADRIHALRNMDMKKENKPLEDQIVMIDRKISETKLYFLPALEFMMEKYQTLNEGKTTLFEKTNKLFFLKKTYMLLLGAINTAECMKKEKQKVLDDEIVQ